MPQSDPARKHEDAQDEGDEESPWAICDFPGCAAIAWYGHRDEDGAQRSVCLDHFLGFTAPKEEQQP